MAPHRFRRRVGIIFYLMLVANPGVAASKTLSYAGGDIDLVIETGEPGNRPAVADIERWVRRAATAVTSFYGRFPVPHVRIVVSRVGGAGIGGTTYGGRLVRMRLGTSTPMAKLDNDWTMTHELFHLAFPDLARRHAWMQEGLSTYFEPVARARVGDMSPERVWRELFSGLPQGLPGEAEGGLDDRPTWGATYWGGALFWLLADLDIRERTGNRRSADDALRAILDAGGDGTADWPIERVLEVGDRATGTTVLATLYEKVARNRFAPDLDALAERLGASGTRLDDRAPLAAIRRSITAPAQPPAP